MAATTRVVVAILALTVLAVTALVVVAGGSEPKYVAPLEATAR